MPGDRASGRPIAWAPMTLRRLASLLLLLVASCRDTAPAPATAESLAPL